MTWTGISIHGAVHLSIFESEEVLWNQKLKDDSRAVFIWKERRGTKHIVNKVKER